MHMFTFFSITTRSALFATLLGHRLEQASQPPSLPRPPAAARDSVSLRGTVRDREGRVVGRATVLLTRPADMRTQTQVSDSLGQFAFREVRGTGEFLLAVRVANFRPVNRRIVFEEGQREVIVPVVLSALADAAGLEVVRIVSKRDAPPPSTNASYGVRAGALEGLADGSPAGQSLVSTGPLDFARTSLLGSPDGEGLSVAGLPGRESQTELNGLLFRGAVLPGNLPKRVQVSAGTYDIASGGYSGGVVSLEIPSAGEFRTVRGDVIASPGGAGARGALTPQSRPFVAADWGGDWRNRSGTGGATFGVRVSRQENETSTLGTVSDPLLETLGVGVSVARTADAFIKQSLLNNRAFAHPRSAGHSVSALVRIDPRITPDAVNAVTLGVTHADQPQGGWSPLSVLSASRRDRTTELLTQWLRSSAQASRARWETRVGLSMSGVTSVPASPGLAELRVTTVESKSDGAFGAPIQLGGAAGVSSRNRVVSEAQLQRTAFAGERGTHTIKVIAAGRLDQLAMSQPARTGAAQFGSIEDLQVLSPQQIEVVQQSPTRGATVGRASAGVGDEWRLAVGKHLQYGLRADLTWLKSAVASGRQSPWIGTLSPRVGFSWSIQPPKSGEGYATSTLFSRHLLPAGVLRVGAGVFHRDLTPDEVLGVQPADGVQRERCLDPGTLTASDVLLPSGLEAQCSASPDVIAERTQSTLAQRYAPPRSLRATANYTASWRNVEVQGAAIVNRTSQQPQAVDRSVRNTPSQLLAGEGQRPFYAPPSAIHPATGLVDRSFTTATPGERQLELASSLSTRTVQGMLLVSPRWNDGGRILRAGYVWTRAQSLATSWTTPSFGALGSRQWLPNARTSEHTVQLEAGKAVGFVNVTAWGRALSGLPYRPEVSGDVNGDGVSSNDAAYVPTRRADAPAVWDQLDAFASTAPKAVRQCLASARNSRPDDLPCRTPWAFESAVSATVELRDLGFRTESVISLQLENVAAFAGALAGASPNRGWGQANTINRVLLRPVGFDEAGSRFDYTVNPAFARRTNSGVEGFRLTLSARIPLSPRIEQQQVSRWLAARGVGSRLPADSLARRFARNVPALYAEILELSDELGLQPALLDSLSAHRMQFDERLQRVWDGMARQLVALPRDFDVEIATTLVQKATDDAWEVSRLEAHAIRELFSPIQRALLPGTVRLLMQSDTPIKQRIVFR